jgi:hypothetical protein
LGHKVEKEDVDMRFRWYMQIKSPLGRLSPMPWWRWYAVDRVGKYSWKYDKPEVLPFPEIVFPPHEQDWEQYED